VASQTTSSAAVTTALEGEEPKAALDMVYVGLCGSPAPRERRAMTG
jgi:hypothetical protein